MGQKQIPQTLTSELLVECLHSDVAMLKSAAAKRIIADNLCSANPLLNFWNIDWNKLNYSLSDISTEIYQQMVHFRTNDAFKNGLKILDSILVVRQEYETYNHICDLLTVSGLDSSFKQSVLAVIKKHTYDNFESLLPRLFSKLNEAPELADIILHMLKRTKNLEHLCSQIAPIDISHTIKWNNNSTEQIFATIIPYMSLERLLRITEICNVNNKLDAIGELIMQKVTEFMQQADTSSRSYQTSEEIAVLLPLKFGCQIFRLFIEKGNNDFVENYISYICNDANYFPKEELEFIAQNATGQCLNICCAIANVFEKYAKNFEYTSKLIDWFSAYKTQIFELVQQNSLGPIGLISAFNKVIEYQEQRIDHLRRLNILPPLVPNPMERHKQIIKICREFIRETYLSIAHNGTTCAVVILLHKKDWRDIIKLWSFDDKKFQDDFLKQLSAATSSSTSHVQDVENYVYEVGKIELTPQLFTERYNRAVLHLLQI